MKFQFLIFLFLLPAIGNAGSSDNIQARIVACEDPADLQNKIESCSDNILAENAARACHDALANEWLKANSELSAAMSVAQEVMESKQQANFSRSHSDMQLAIDKLANLIELTEDAADKLALYPRIMFDNPYALPGLELSSNCYKSSFLAISKIVEDLDKKSDEGEDALTATDKLRGVSQARDDGIATGFTHSMAGSRTSGIGSGTSSNGSSDVTGVEDDRAKRGGANESGSAPRLSAPPFRSSAAKANTLPEGPNPDAFTGEMGASYPGARAPGLGTKIDPSGTFSSRGSLSSGGAAVGDFFVPASPGDVGESSESSLLNAVLPGNSGNKGAPFTGEDKGVWVPPDKIRRSDSP